MPTLDRVTVKTCTHAGCAESVWENGLSCFKHYREWQNEMLDEMYPNHRVLEAKRDRESAQNNGFAVILLVALGLGALWLLAALAHWVSRHP